MQCFVWRHINSAHTWLLRCLRIFYYSMHSNSRQICFCRTMFTAFWCWLFSKLKQVSKYDWHFNVSYSCITELCYCNACLCVKDVRYGRQSAKENWQDICSISVTHWIVYFIFEHILCISLTFTSQISIFLLFSLKFVLIAFKTKIITLMVMRLYTHCVMMQTTKLKLKRKKKKTFTHISTSKCIIIEPPSIQSNLFFY